MTQLVSKPNMYPGMGCSSTEFFIDGDQLKFIQNCKVLPFFEMSSATMQLLEEAIEQDERVKVELNAIFPDSRLKRIEQFAKCRFGGLDFQGDIKDGVLQDGEYWPCPKRGNCQSEGILCKMPVYNGERLSSQDVKLMQLTATNMTNEVIAEEMDLPLGSFHKAKKHLYKKFGILTKQQSTMISMFLNLIQF